MTEAAAGNKSWWAKATLVGSVIALVLLFLGPVGTRLGIWGFQTGLLLIVPAGVLLAAIGLLVGLISIFVSKKRGFDGDPPSLFISIAICAVIMVTMGLQFQKGASVPAIHNISTDVVDPPRFTEAIVALRGENSNPLTYEADELAVVQQGAYPDVKPLTVASSPADTVRSVVSALEDMGLEIVTVDEGLGVVEATDTTFWFGFKDDVVVRVQASGEGSLVDVRSVSRVGLSDLGKNADRIMDLLGRLGA
ncbi:MAG: DUF1499 domain-containing protein [Gammaproteobacteria bacterium]|nr:MAG: DUF1499 domain-containing protein [Gammaproteobacteria bacterium]